MFHVITAAARQANSPHVTAVTQSPPPATFCYRFCQLLLCLTHMYRLVFGQVKNEKKTNCIQIIEAVM